MKNTIFVSTYHNNPQFIEWQTKTFKKFVQDEYDFAVLDDSEDTTRSIISNGLARDEIYNECIKYGARHIAVPQSIHDWESNGGYVPNENASTHHPTERHQALMRWLFKNNKSLGFHEYKTMVLMDSDAFINNPINISQYMTHDIIGSSRTQYINLPLGNFPDKMFPEKVKQLNNTTVQFFTLCLMCINMEKVTNLESMDMGTWPGVDTGGRTSFFIKDNPQYTYAHMVDRGDIELRTEYYSKDPNFATVNSEFLHYRGGSNWSYENTDYCRSKLYHLIRKHYPDLATDLPTINYETRSRDGEHSLNKE